MKHDELKSIWKDAGEKLSQSKNWDANLKRRKTSDRISKTLRGGIVFDIILKFIIATAAFLLLMYSDFDRSYVLFSVISLVFLLSMIATGIYSKKKLEAISPDLPIVDNLEQKLEFMQTTYKQYMFSSAFTAPMMVFTGNCYYFHFTYGEMRFNDPVILGFLFIAFVIGFFAQLPLYRSLLNEIMVCVGDFDQEKQLELELIRRRHKITNIILISVGTLFLIAGVLLFYLL